MKSARGTETCRLRKQYIGVLTGQSQVRRPAVTVYTSCQLDTGNKSRIKKKKRLRITHSCGMMGPTGVKMLCRAPCHTTIEDTVPSGQRTMCDTAHIFFLEPEGTPKKVVSDWGFSSRALILHVKGSYITIKATWAP